MKHETKTAKRYGSSLRIYDNGGRTFDRYTILPPRDAGTDYREKAPGTWTAIAASENPFHPQGFGQHTSAMPGPHLGKRIHWRELPPDVQRFACQSFRAFAFDLDTIARHICLAAAWADCEERTHPRVSHAALVTARAFAEAFVSEFPALTLAVLTREHYGWHNGKWNAPAQFGHDLYLTARGHGVGFWDRDSLREGDLGERISAPLRDEFRRWYIEPEFYRGWMYLSTPGIARVKEAA